ncbi:uncharacterized protein LOC128858436 isoform X1 [Anastrepha ludens]|uniref:uncharacterized protein LOC128858436 isoform X1 n=2 Tax=Anastrepha ludens TaxID=28586 RepID=UPI0023B1F6B0|nr:uncharacterized protein LOC128858436 isoform X1 [Anastrepha ludens]
MDTQKLTNGNTLAGGIQLVKERNRSSNKVKLCGYLKKKRNKVGGWRKMWFVLQDKLLLSYASKEEYDNKLVSFKDVLNLVPGTMVRPLGGFRFTIETTTHVMYTFHCDDRNAYREWITMLLDSLSATTSSQIIAAISSPSSRSTSAYSLLPLQQQRFRNISVDNIPHGLWSSAAQNSQRQRELSSSCEYAYFERLANKKSSNELKATTRSSLAPALSLPTPGSGGAGGVAAVRLPIAGSTAKILERNGVNSSSPKKKYQQQYKKRQQQQVNCCNRSSGTTVNATSSKSKSNNNNSNDNVTAGRLSTEVCATHFRLHGESNWTEFNNLDSVQAQSSAGSTSSSASASASTYQSVNQSVLKINSMFQQQSTSSSASEGASFSRHHMVNKEFLLYPKSSVTNCDKNEFIPKYNHNNKTNNDTTDRNSTLLVDCSSINDVTQVADDNIRAAYSCCTKDSKAMVMVKDQIQRMNIKGRKETMSYTNADAVDRREQRRVVVTKRLEEESLVETANMSKAVDADAKRKSLGSNAEIDAVDPQLDMVRDVETSFNRSSEPIYAVVDLAHKYAQRQQRNGKNNLKNVDANRCRSYESIIQGVEPSIGEPIRGGLVEKSINKLYAEDDIDGIYEDGDKFEANCENGSTQNCDDDENIYEPVGFDNFTSPKTNASTTQPNALWRYITRLKVNSLLHFTRMRRNNHVDYDTIRLPIPTPSPTLAASHKKATTLTKKQSSTASPTATTSQFACIKHKFGAHRKSMQVRVRKMCARTYEPKTNFNNRQPTQQQISSNDHFVVGASSGSSCGGGANGGGSSAEKKPKYRWKSVKIRPKHFNGAYNGVNCNSTTDDISHKSTRQRFFGSLPHLRKARVSLFSTPNLHMSEKDQNSNVSEVVDKTTAETSLAVNKSVYDKLNK